MSSNWSALYSGAHHQQQTHNNMQQNALGSPSFAGCQDDGWRSMESAPRDGTPIEIRCTYGVAPWYGLYRWTDEFTSQGQIFHGEPRWAKIGNDCSSLSEDHSFSWRPYSGTTTSYIDPTGGMQDDPAYWRGAVAQKYGLPLNHFERSWWQNLLSLFGV